QTSDELVDQVLQHLLAAGGELRLGLSEDVRGDLIEGDGLALDLGADAFVPGGVAFGDELVQTAIGADGGGDFQAAGEGIHAADVSVEEVLRLVGFATALGVEVEPAGGEAAGFQQLEHDRAGEVEIGRELVG